MDFLKRTFYGFIALVALIIILLIPNLVVTGILFGIIAVVAMYEYIKAISKICNPIKWVAYASCIIVPIINHIPHQYLGLTIGTIFASILLLLFSKVIATDMKTTFKDVAYTLFGILYAAGLIAFLALIDGMNNGKILLLYTFFAAWTTDTFAYVFGRKIGKHKFSQISPKKSIEGCISGTVCAIIAMMIYTAVLNNCFGYGYSYVMVGITGFILSLIGEIGDLSASAIKRYVDIKDFGNLLPGHGGMLDRMDSVMFIAPFAFLMFNMLGM